MFIFMDNMKSHKSSDNPLTYGLAVEISYNVNMFPTSHTLRPPADKLNISRPTLDIINKCARNVCIGSIVGYDGLLA